MTFDGNQPYSSKSMLATTSFLIRNTKPLEDNSQYLETVACNNDNGWIG